MKVCSVVSFPLGANTLEVKTFEAEKAISVGMEKQLVERFIKEIF